MRCEDVQQRISDALDGGQPLDTAFRRHVDRCATCAAFERDCRELDDLLAAGRLTAPAATSRRPIRIGLIIGGLAAAIIVLALLPAWRSPRPPQPEPRIAVNNALPNLDPDVRWVADATEAAVVAPVRQELASLATDARAVTNSLLSCLPSPSGFTPRK